MQQPGNEGIPQVLDARTEIKNLLMETREEMRSMARSMLEDFSTELHGNIQQNAPVEPHPPGPPMPRQRPDPRHTEGLSINPSFHSEHGHITEPPERPVRRNSANHTPENQRFNNTYNHPRQAAQYYIKLPPFTGKERWDIWYNRFTDVAGLREWDEEQRLVELLPRLQGPAGEFVYGQLSLDSRRNYGRLIQELNSRFRVVETTKTYRALFSNRDQRSGETPESYAAELKRLYDKAYPNRDHATRAEDLVRRFMDGLGDEAARFHIEYIKDPVDIDHAVYEAVNFQETKRRQSKREAMDGRHRRPTRQARQQEGLSELEGRHDELATPFDDYGSDDDDYGRIARAPGRPKKSQVLTHPTTSNQTVTSTDTVAKSSPPPAAREKNDMATAKLENVLDKILDKLEAIEKGCHPSPDRSPRSNPSNGQPYSPQNNRTGGRANNPRQQPRQRGGCCYNCGTEGHFARECPSAPWVTGQMHVAVQPGIPTTQFSTRHSQSTQRAHHNQPGLSYLPPSAANRSAGGAGEAQRTPGESLLN